ncbi:hypothetical protein QTP88_022836 [Uroleucon formosanum]
MYLRVQGHRFLYNLYSRKLNESTRHPTFRNLFCLNYFQHSPNANCIKDLDDILCHMNPQEFESSNVMLPEPSTSGTYFSFKIGTVDYRHLNLPEKNALHYLFVRFRIFSSVKFLNRVLVSERQFKNRKLTILKHL